MKSASSAALIAGCVLSLPLAWAEEADDDSLITPGLLNETIAQVTGGYTSIYANYKPSLVDISTVDIQDNIQGLVQNQDQTQIQVFDTTEGGAKYTGQTGDGQASTGYLNFYWQKDANGNYRLMQAWGKQFSNPLDGAEFAFSVAYQNVFTGTNETNGNVCRYDWLRYANAYLGEDANNEGTKSVTSFLEDIAGEKDEAASNTDVVIYHANKNQYLRSDGNPGAAQGDGQDFTAGEKELTGFTGRVYADLKNSYRIDVGDGYTIGSIENTAFIDNSSNGVGKIDGTGYNIITVRAGGTINLLENVVFINNYTQSSSSTRGNCIDNWGTIGNISGSFIGNYAHTTGGNSAAGGVMINRGPEENNGTAATMGDVSGYFIGNHIIGDANKEAGGIGAVVANYGYLHSLKGVFIGNYSSTSGPVSWQRANSGVIRNYSTGMGYKAILGEYEGDAEDNFDFNTRYYEGEVNANGRYVYKYVDDQRVLKDGAPIALGGVFIGNWATSRGGVMFNNGEIHGMILGDFIGNYVYSANGLAQGGALANDSAYKDNSDADTHMTTIDGAFTGNYAYNDTASEGKWAYKGLNADGGAIFNRNAAINNLLADFKENYASSKDGTAHGGAVYHIQQKYVMDQDDVSSLYEPATGKGDLNPGDLLGVSILTQSSIANIGADSDHRSQYEGNFAKGAKGAEGGAIYIATNYEKWVQENGVYVNKAGSYEEEMSADAINNKAIKELEETYGSQGWESHQIDYDLRASVGNVYADFTGNYAEATGENGKAYGGAMYISNYSEAGNLRGKYVGNKVINHGGSAAEAKGGALYIGQGAVVGNIRADFTDNEARGEGQVRGGALLVTKGATIGVISGMEGSSVAATFKGNKAIGSDETTTGYLIGGEMYASLNPESELLTEEQKETLRKLNEKLEDGGTLESASAIHAYLNTNVYGGAIRFDDSVIVDLSAEFINNVTNGSGGALSLTESGFIYKVTGNFEGNQAGVEGGAVHNLGTIGYLGEIWYDGGWKDDALTDDDNFSLIGRDKDGVVITQSDATPGVNLTGYGEYDGSIRGGFENVNFMNNVVNSITLNNGNRGKGAAIYTTDDLFITVTKGEKAEISGNIVYYTSNEGKDDTKMTDAEIDEVDKELKELGQELGLRDALKDGDTARKLNTAIYVDNIGKPDEDGNLPQRVVYLTVEQKASLTITDAIRGQEALPGGFILRLRGFKDRDDAVTTHHWLDDEDNTRGVINLSGPIAESYVIMDDVRLRLDECINNFSFGTASNLDYCLYGYSEEDTSVAAKYKRSDIFRRSTLDVRSGLVDLTGDDGKITQFAFGTLTAYGKGYTYIDNAYDASDAPDSVKAAYDQDVYARWRVDISLDDKTADLITTFEVRGADGNILPATGDRGYQMSVGRITLDAFTVNHLYKEEYSRYKEGDIEEGNTIKVQILNLVVFQGADIADYTNLKDLDGNVIDYTTSEDTPIQLDTDFDMPEWEGSHMKSTDVLAQAVRLATTRTYHDSIEIIGWRNTLAAWAEFTGAAEDSRYENVEWEEWDASKEKVFTLEGDYSLTRHVEDLKGRGEAYDGAVFGDNWTITSNSKNWKLDMKQQNLLTKVLVGQTARLQNFTLKNVMGNKMVNNGTMLTLDTMSVEDGLTITNNTSLTVTGEMNINNTITSDADAPGEMIIENSSQVKDIDNTVINITGTVQNQNITHQESAIATLADVEVTEDAPKTVTNLVVTNTDGTTTKAFENFKGNSLTMIGGQFNLYDMALNRLPLENLTIAGGKINVTSATVDLADKKMGGINVAGDAAITDGSTGVIWLDAVKLVSDSKEKVTHVTFVPEGVGDAVQDNKIQGSTVWGPVWEYAVTYNDTDNLDSDGIGGKNGQYTYTRTGNVNPSAQSGQATQLTGGYAAMTQIYEYSFEHADLFTTAPLAARNAQLYGGNAVVTPTKAKDGYRAPEASTGCSGVNAKSSGMWVHPYASFESMTLKNGPKMDANLYGAMVGGDSDIVLLNNGWSTVTTVYGAYMGGKLRYTGNRTTQNGGAVGLTQTFYKNNFHAAITASIATMTGDTSNAYGSEDYTMVMGGVAARAGYNFELAEGKYIIQPIFMVSYTLFNAFDYTNAAGVRVKTEPMQVLQLHPYVRFIKNTNCEWKPYVTAGYVHNISSSAHYKANDEALPSLSVKPYAEYSLGVQRLWKDRYTFYGQVTGRSGGRKGVEISAGTRWNW